MPATLHVLNSREAALPLSIKELCRGLINKNSRCIIIIETTLTQSLLGL